MRGFAGLTKRNLALYFKDVQSVIFSLLTSIIVFVLYLLFLKGTFVDTIENAMKGLENFISEESVDMLVNGILLTGILGSAMITVPYNCLQTIIKDRENKIDYDISATPMKRWQIVLSYFVSAALSSIIMTAVILTIGLLCLKGFGDPCISVENICKAYGIICIGSVSATAFFMVLALFFNSTAASGAFFGILSAASGFVIGAYIPLSTFSEGIQNFCNIFPATHVTILLRNALLDGILVDMNDAIGGVDQGLFVESMKEAFNFEGFLFGNALTHENSLWYIVGIMLVCLLILVVVYNRTYKRK